VWVAYWVCQWAQHQQAETYSCKGIHMLGWVANLVCQYAQQQQAETDGHGTHYEGSESRHKGMKVGLVGSEHGILGIPVCSDLLH
jgi:hypothetical protein